MKKYLASILLTFGILFFSFLGATSSYAGSSVEKTELQVQANSSSHVGNPSQNSSHLPDYAPAQGDHEEEVHHSTPGWLVIPFVVLLLMIATGPLFYEHFWHHNYPKIAVGFSILVVLYYLFVLDNVHGPVHALAEYIQFIALLASLYVASGGILIEIDKKATPLANVLLLLIGSVISNLIGTTGASMLLIRPFIRLNKANIRPYHVVFFILMVSNVGGSLTPIGDPPCSLDF